MTVIDIVRETIEAAEKNARNKRIKFVAADVRSMPFASSAFDAVILPDVLEHVYLPERSLSEVKRVLKPGGRVIITVPDEKKVQAAKSIIELVPILADRLLHTKGLSPNHINVFDEASLKSALKKEGFKVVRLRKSPAGVGLRLMCVAVKSAE
ncbi:MAG: class I SAM-dependent methyltransferase [archaeon]